MPATIRIEADTEYVIFHVVSAYRPPLASVEKIMRRIEKKVGVCFDEDSLSGNNDRNEIRVDFERCLTEQEFELLEEIQEHKKC